MQIDEISKTQETEYIETLDKGFVKLVDFNDVDNNTFQVINQYTFIEYNVL